MHWQMPSTCDSHKCPDVLPGVVATKVSVIVASLGDLIGTVKHATGISG